MAQPKRVTTVRLTEDEITWARAHGGIAAVVRDAMQQGQPTPRARGERCPHPITRRIGTLCALCGQPVTS